MSATKYIIGGAAMAGAAYYVYDSNQRGVLGTPVATRARNDIQNLASKTQNGIEHVADKAQGGLQNGLDSAQHEIQTGLHKAQQGIQNGLHNAQHGIENTLNKAQNGIENGLNSAQHGLNKATGGLQDAAASGFKDIKEEALRLKHETLKAQRSAEEAAEWTRDKYNEIAHALTHATAERKQELRAQYGRKYDQVANATAEERKLVLAHLDTNKNPLLRTADWYIDTVNDAGITTENFFQAIKRGVVGVKNVTVNTADAAVDAVVGAKDAVVNVTDSAVNAVAGARETVIDTADSAVNTVVDTKREWLGASASDLRALTNDAAANATAANAVRGWGELATEASEDVARANGSLTRDVNGKLVNWTNDKLSEAKSAADAALSKAQSELEAAQKEFASAGKGWFSSADAKEVAQKKLDEAQRLFDQATRASAPYAKQIVSVASDGLSYLKSGAGKAVELVKDNSGGLTEAVKDNLEVVQQYGKEYIGSASASDIKEERLAAQTKSALHGWGATAEELAEEEYNEVFAKNDNATGKIWKWAFTNKESAEEALAYARSELESAQKELRSTNKSWYQFGKTVDADVQAKAQKQVELAQKGLAHAEAQAKKFAEKANQTFWTGAKDAVDSTKDGLDVANDKAQSGLEGVKLWINK